MASYLEAIRELHSLTRRAAVEALASGLDTRRIALDAWAEAGGISEPPELVVPGPPSVPPAISWETPQEAPATDAVAIGAIHLTETVQVVEPVQAAVEVEHPVAVEEPSHAVTEVEAQAPVAESPVAVEVAPPEVVAAEHIAPEVHVSDDADLPVAVEASAPVAVETPAPVAVEVDAAAVETEPSVAPVDVSFADDVPAAEAAPTPVAAEPISAALVAEAVAPSAEDVDVSFDEPPAAPVEAAPVEAAPVEAAPVEAAPVEAAPVEASALPAPAEPEVEVPVTLPLPVEADSVPTEPLHARVVIPPADAPPTMISHTMPPGMFSLADLPTQDAPEPTMPLGYSGRFVLNETPAPEHIVPAEHEEPEEHEASLELETSPAVEEVDVPLSLETESSEVPTPLESSPVAAPEAAWMAPPAESPDPGPAFFESPEAALGGTIPSLPILSFAPPEPAPAVVAEVPVAEQQPTIAPQATLAPEEPAHRTLPPEPEAVPEAPVIAAATESATLFMDVRDLRKIISQGKAAQAEAPAPAPPPPARDEAIDDAELIAFAAGDPIVLPVQPASAADTAPPRHSTGDTAPSIPSALAGRAAPSFPHAPVAMEPAPETEPMATVPSIPILRVSTPAHVPEATLPPPSDSWRLPADSGGWGAPEAAPAWSASAETAPPAVAAPEPEPAAPAWDAPRPASALAAWDAEAAASPAPAWDAAEAAPATPAWDAAEAAPAAARPASALAAWDAEAAAPDVPAAPAWDAPEPTAAPPAWDAPESVPSLAPESVILEPEAEADLALTEPSTAPVPSRWANPAAAWAGPTQWGTKPEQLASQEPPAAPAASAWEPEAAPAAPAPVAWDAEPVEAAAPPPSAWAAPAAPATPPPSAWAAPAAPETPRAPTWLESAAVMREKNAKVATADAAPPSWFQGAPNTASEWQGQKVAPAGPSPAWLAAPDPSPGAKETPSSWGVVPIGATTPWTEPGQPDSWAAPPPVVTDAPTPQWSPPVAAQGVVTPQWQPAFKPEVSATPQWNAPAPAAAPASAWDAPAPQAAASWDAQVPAWPASSEPASVWGEMPAEAPPPPALKIAGDHKVILHTLEGGVKRGTASQIDLASETLVLTASPGAQGELVQLARAKAIFFIAQPGERSTAAPGRKVKVTFTDGRSVEGYLGDEAGRGFFLLPLDPKSNTARVYVLNHAVMSVA